MIRVQNFIPNYDHSVLHWEYQDLEERPLQLVRQDQVKRWLYENSGFSPYCPEV